MNLHKLTTSAFCLLITMALCTPVLADQKTDWIELQKGYEGKIIGAKVAHIENLVTEDSKRITIAIPKSTMNTTAAIQEIVVTGKAPKKEAQPRKLNISYEWADNYEGDYYGLIITLGNATNFPIRLYLKGDTNPP